MIGEFEFEGIFTEHDDPDANEKENKENALMIPFPECSTVLFIVFVFVLSIIIMNLMVGLAVDDIKEIQDTAELQKLSMHVVSVTNLDTLTGYRCAGVGVGVGEIPASPALLPLHPLPAGLRPPARKAHQRPAHLLEAEGRP